MAYIHYAYNLGGIQCPPKVTILRLRRAMKHKAMAVMALVSIMGEQAGIQYVLEAG